MTKTDSKKSPEYLNRPRANIDRTLVNHRKVTNGYFIAIMQIEKSEPAREFGSLPLPTCGWDFEGKLWRMKFLDDLFLHQSLGCCVRKASIQKTGKSTKSWTLLTLLQLSSLSLIITILREQCGVSILPSKYLANFFVINFRLE